MTPSERPQGRDIRLVHERRDEPRSAYGGRPWLHAEPFLGRPTLGDILRVPTDRELRRFAMEGRGVEDVLTSWQRKLDYGYFAARIDDTFRFAESRRWAEGRVKRLEQLMNDMITENQAGDMPDVQ